MIENWVDRCRRSLISAANGPSWGYRRGSTPAVEPTALAALGLLATMRGSDDPARMLVQRAADWLAKIQGSDGALGVSATLSTPGWATPYALLLWQALGSHDASRRRAADWLLAEKVDAPPRATGPGRDIASHDTTIPGWPWVEGTHSWVEPSALALLVLAREARSGSSRFRDGIRLLQDRAIESGGWNYGNNVVFGRMLRPQPAPTGLALLALAHARANDGIVNRATTYLRTVLPTVRAASSLGWGLLGLRAWRAAPDMANDWLAASATETLPRNDSAFRLGLILLASSEQALDILGLPPMMRRS